MGRSLLLGKETVIGEDSKDCCMKLSILCVIWGLPCGPGVHRQLPRHPNVGDGGRSGLRMHQDTVLCLWLPGGGGRVGGRQHPWHVGHRLLRKPLMTG